MLVYKSIYKISKMDCPSEEQIIRMKLDSVQSIKNLDFNIAERTLSVIHTDNQDTIFNKLNSLNFDTKLIATSEFENYTEQNDKVDSKLLWQVLLINLFFFFLESSFAYFSKSMSLLADGLDMLADTFIYSLALYAIGRSASKKQNIARLSGYLQLLLAIMGMLEIIRRFISNNIPPEFMSMIIISIFALIGNATCLYLLQKSKSKEAHMRASMIFTSNDVIVNIGVIIAGILVYFSNSLLPDLVIGSIVFILVAMGARKIIYIKSE